MGTATTGQISEDLLWTWDGKKWNRIDRVEVACGRCSKVVAVEHGKSTFKCPEGHRQDFVGCKTCTGAFQRPYEHRQYDTRCPHCQFSGLYITVLSAWDFAADQARRGLWPIGSSRVVDSDQRELRDFTLAAAGGTRIPTGSRCWVVFTSEGAKITAIGADEEFIPYRDIETLEITGSVTKSGGGYIGGGFGVEAAVGGMLAAGVLNALSSRTQVFSLVRLAGRTAEYIFVSHSVASGALQMMLTPVQLRIRQAQPPAATSSASSSSMADELAKLAQLRDSGVLSDAEFGAAKARILERV